MFNIIFIIELVSENYISVILGIFGFVFSIYQVFVIIQAHKTRHWIKTNGSIESSTTYKALESFHDETDRTSWTYSPSIFYSYEIEGEKFISNTVFIGDKIYLPSKKFSENLRDKYQISKQVSVHYNPQNQSQSVLETGIHSINILLFFIGIGIISFAIIIY